MTGGAAPPHPPHSEKRRHAALEEREGQSGVWRFFADGETRIQLLPHPLGGEARHHRQHLEQAVGRSPTWPLITEDEQDRQMQRLASSIQRGESLNPGRRDYSVKLYVDAHPEKELLAYVFGRLSDWRNTIPPAKSDKYVMLAIPNLVSCIAHVPMTSAKP